MTNADKFREVFGIYATEIWAKPENEFLKWLNTDFARDIEMSDTRWIPVNERLPEEHLDVLVCNSETVQEACQLIHNEIVEIVKSAGELTYQIYTDLVKENE